ncbi:MAG: DUF86 domain-containing protein [Caldilineales bacterium]
MSKRDPRLFLIDILEATAHIAEYTDGMSYDDFLEQRMVRDAVVRNLEIIGEASRQLPEELRLRFSQIPWSRMMGFRNVAIHAYSTVDWQSVWEIRTRYLPDLGKQITRILDELALESSEEGDQ